MNIKSKKFAVVALITFAILFAMNYIGNDQPDRLYRATLTAVAGVLGLTAGFWFLYKNKDDKQHPDFD